jgi:hypothetical protein
LPSRPRHREQAAVAFHLSKEKVRQREARSPAQLLEKSSADVVQSCLLKWCGWIARRPSHFINDCIVKYEKNLRAAV